MREVVCHADTTFSSATRSDAETDAGANAFPWVCVRSAITTFKSDVLKQSTVYLYGMAVTLAQSREIHGFQLNMPEVLSHDCHCFCLFPKKRLVSPIGNRKLNAS